MYYGIRRETKAALKGAIENYLVFYNEERIKASLGGLSIKEHRDKLAKCPAFSPKPLLSYNPQLIAFDTTKPLILDLSHFSRKRWQRMLLSLFA